MDAERRRILEMLQAGTVNVDQAARLLEALEQAQKAEAKQVAVPEPAPEVWRGPRSIDWRDVVRGLAEQIRATIPQALGGRRGVGGGTGPGGHANFSTATLTREFLERVGDDSTYTNFGVLAIADDVPEELLRAKIGSYVNFGATHGRAALLQILKDRCSVSFGGFREGRAEAGPVTPAPAPPAPAVAPMEETVITGWALAGGWQDWAFHDQYRELVVQCHAGHLVFEGVEEGMLELAVGKPVAEGEGLPSGWAGGIPVAPRQDGSRLVFELGSAEHPDEEVTFRFGVPEGVSVTADTASGNIAADSISGSVTLNTGRGHVTCSEINGWARVGSRGGNLTLSDINGSVRADTAGGDIRLRDASGGVSVQTASGSIEVSDISGGVNAISGRGEVKASDISGSLKVHTGGGDIEAHDISGSATADTGAGNVSLHDISGSVSARSRVGDLDIRDVSGSATLEAVQGTISVSDVSGTVTRRGG